MSKTISTGAALAYAEQQLGGPLVEEQSVVQSNSLVATQIVPYNGDRVGLVIMNVGGIDTWLSLSAPTNTQNGIYLPANGGFVSFNVRDDFTFPAHEWWSFPAAGGTQLLQVTLRRFALAT